MKKIFSFLMLLFLLSFVQNGFAAEKTGILLLEHGGNQDYNEGTRNLSNDVQKATGVPVSLGYVCCVTWGNSGSMQYGVDKLVEQGVTNIVIIPAFSHVKDSGLIERAYNILGIGPVSPSPFNREMMGGNLKFAKVPDNVNFIATDGWRGDDFVADILIDRAKDVSSNPKEETLFVLDHGATFEFEMPEYEKAIGEMVETVKARSPFKRVAYGYIRDDAAKEIRASQIEKIRKTIEEASKDSEVIIVYPLTQNLRSMKPGGKWLRDLKGLNFKYNSYGLYGHPNLVKWFEKQYEEAVKSGKYVKSDSSKFNQVIEVSTEKKGMPGMDMPNM